MPVDTSERNFQSQIIEHLCNTGYRQRSATDFDKSLVLDPEMAVQFVQMTQKLKWQKWEKMTGERAREQFLYRLDSELKRKGTIEVIREGFKEMGIQFDLFYPAPHNSLNPNLAELFGLNIWSVIEEVKYQPQELGNRIDLVLFVNGIPIITVELKNTFSQGVEKAMSQYRKDRDPQEKIFTRCLVHFAMSDQKVYMTTKLAGEKTRFLPFNIDSTNPQPENDFATAYMYKDVWQAHSLARLLSHYIFWEEGDGNKDGQYIFPRFHQRGAVDSLLSTARPSENYLIQHSAGSGKTKTIAWLAHGLLNAYDESNNRLYNMVIVVSDRKVIDEQLQEQVQAIEKRRGVVEKIDKNSAQLAEAIQSGANIVVTTVQKFPFVIDELADIEDRSYAIIVDEAHSSQSGENARHLRQAITTSSLDEAEQAELAELTQGEQELYQEMARSKGVPNASFFAFTATPKQKTLELFGTKQDDGAYRPFHMYSMRQAIEEGFIKDVLENYVSYPSYFQLMKKVETDPQYDKKHATRLLRNMVEKHPATIDRKSRIMVNHFLEFSSAEMRGKAKAMVVTRSRFHAVEYKKAIDRVLKEQGIEMKTLVAFSGTVPHDGIEYTEKGMNKLPDKMSIQQALKTDPYRILIVANKFQTGFDEPMLQTMYVDKMLNGVAAVQTLSRLNRIHPDKKRTLVIDFANDPEVIQKAFLPYYGETYLKEGTDPHKLYELEDALYGFLLFDRTTVEDFIREYKSLDRTANQNRLAQYLRPATAAFEVLEKEQQLDFRSRLKRFISMYSFLSQLITYHDFDLERLYVYSQFLMKYLPTINEPLPFSVLQDTDLALYRLEPKDARQIHLIEDGELNPMSSGNSYVTDSIQEKLSLIVQDLNAVYGADTWSDDDKVLVSRVYADISDDEEFATTVRHNSRESVEAVFEERFNKALGNILEKNAEFYHRIIDDNQLKTKLKQTLLDRLYVDMKDRE